MGLPSWLSFCGGVIAMLAGVRVLVHPERHVDAFRWWEERPLYGANRQPLAADKGAWVLAARIIGAGLVLLGGILIVGELLD